jgi:C-terminal processing protease CtpA/Prc
MSRLRWSGLFLSAFVFLTFFPVYPLFSQQKMDSINRERAIDILRDAYENVKKHYYDPKYHGLDIDARYHEYDGKIRNANSLGQAFGIVAAYLDGLKDSHTFFDPPPRPFHLDYGYRMQMYGDNCFISTVRPGTDAETKVHPGDQVLTLNTYDVNRGDFWNMEYYFNTLSPQKASNLQLRDPAGRERAITVDAKVRQLKRVMDLTGADGGNDFNDLIREMEHEAHAVRQRLVEMGDVAIWNMPEFDLEDQEVDRIFGVARKHKALVLDLRGNPGGAVVTLERMISDIFDHEVKIADRIGRKELKPQIAKAHGGDKFTGKIVVLVDSRSASAAELFARVMQLEKRGTVIGDKSAGAVMEALHYSGSQGTDTKIFYGFSITDADLIMKDGKSLEHVGVMPDEIMLPSAKDLAEGRDPVLARAVEIAGGHIEPAAAGKLFPIEWLPN